MKYLGKVEGIFIVWLAPLFLFIWPCMDLSRERHPLKRPVSMTIGILVVLSLLVLGMMGYLSETKRQFFGRTVEFDIYGIPHRVTPGAEVLEGSGVSGSETKGWGGGG